MILSFDDSPLAVLRRKKDAIENAIRVLEEYQKLICAADPRGLLPADLGMDHTIELLLQRDLFPMD
jgi:hypothetical protein